MIVLSLKSNPPAGVASFAIDEYLFIQSCPNIFSLKLYNMDSIQVHGTILVCINTSCANIQYVLCMLQNTIVLYLGAYMEIGNEIHTSSKKPPCVLFLCNGMQDNSLANIIYSSNCQRMGGGGAGGVCRVFSVHLICPPLHAQEW